jgi:hypothetical protein
MAFFLLPLIALSLDIQTVMAQGVPAWQAEHLKAVARIESRKCIGPCASVANDPLTRVGTGFLVKLDGFSDPVIVTALHVVAGANNITYQVTELDPAKVPTKVIAVDFGGDIAVLAPTSQYMSAVRPVELGEARADARGIYVYGYKLGAQALFSGEGRVKLKAPGLLSEMPFDRRDKELIRAVGYPDLELAVVGLEGALSPGDSGAAVFNEAGRVIGMAHGGIPSSGGQIAWMVPASKLRQLRPNAVAVDSLKELTIKDAFAATNAFYSASGANRTAFGTNPSVAFAFQWPAVTGPINTYARRLAEKSARDHTWLEGPRGRVYLARAIVPGEEAFPASRDEPRHLNCAGGDASSIHCPAAKRRERRLIDTLNAMVVEVSCFRASTVEAIIKSKEARLPQADLELRIPVGDFESRVGQGELEWAYQWNGPSTGVVYLGSKRFVEYKFGAGSYRRPEIDYLEDLYGGACSIGLRSSVQQFADDTAALERALKMGGACFHLILSPNTHTPVSATAYLPLGDDLAEGRIWGVLPQSHQGGTIDDLACQ